MRNLLTEVRHFFLANVRASYFGIFLILLFVITEFVTIPGLERYDVIFLAAVSYQICALVFRLESLKEFAVIIIFHALATGMELFKTHPAVGSWVYPGVESSMFAIASVPLFTGFLYSAVGNYISRAFIFLKLTYINFPAQYHLWLIAGLIYVNFFTHHFVYDIRYVLFLYILIIFYKTKVHFQVYRQVRSIPFLVSGILTALCVWVAENIATFTNIWLYPNQVAYWQLVSFSKTGSWFLLLILSFALVTIIYQDRLKLR